MIDPDKISKNFRKLPEVNPKTGEPFAQHLCIMCGALVIDRKVHYNWHARLSQKMREILPVEWPPKDYVESLRNKRK